MRDIIIGSALMILFLLFVGHFSISFKPFSIALPYWHRSLGIFLLILSLVIYNVGEHGIGYKKGLKDGSDITIKALLEKAKEKESNINNK